ncbi:hypothetical protein BABINDRAFT_8281 [Babjeviella inositovora NRRL Y-12698]|uniref:Phosphatidyl-N-methylethanolamine N-methyltransferase n=1 Tax=Babjeviella inositovora NRRL Y-12698 TaxID=984486 RepID=A0A1E3QNW3_9ASCO|nr:uncharacterized protein BABINDRAFT_8281 [Babjeviella inositovora NRRL Y-12698]ODQ79328.1 hypothetical protein BABINDRAFT_8281 [Babjeviella inositovora NRRL Y-12698]
MEFVTEFFSKIDYSQKTFKYSLFLICFNPTFWNVAARLEYEDKTLTKFARGNARYGCYGLAVAIFSLGIYRDFIYELALRTQPVMDALTHPLIKVLAVLIFLSGNVLVLSSMWALGVTGTYLGDYFGIMMDERVTGFPFNICSNPMYDGSSLCFLGTGLYFGKPAGIFTSFFVFLVYRFALLYEEPFTAMIYAKRDQKSAQKKAE